MYSIKKDFIYVTKGDSFGIVLSKLKLSDGTPYELQEGDIITFTVRKKVDGEIVIQTAAVDNIIDVTKDQSKMLNPGPCVYDIQLDTAAGDRYTIKGPTSPQDRNMYVYPEVTEE